MNNENKEMVDGIVGQNIHAFASTGANEMEACNGVREVVEIHDEISSCGDNNKSDGGSSGCVKDVESDECAKGAAPAVCNEGDAANTNIAESNDVVKATKQPKKLVTKLISAIALGVVFGLFAGAAFFGIQNHLSAVTTADVTLEAADLVEAPEGEVVSTNISTVAANVMPSVVSITNRSVQEVQSFFFGTQKYEAESNGTGIIVGSNNSELLIATNNHVIQGNKALTVTFVDNKTVEAMVKGADANVDIAVIAVKIEDMDSETLETIKVATLGDSEKLIVGEPTIAIGNALGYGQSVTSGIVSAVNRKMDGFDTGLVQTDAAINPGNSGGALLNIRGEVIGINTAKVAADAVEGMGYAIPISEVKEIIEEMMSRETREKVPENKKGKIGISCVDVDETAAKYYNMPIGAYINEVEKDGAADKAGISKGSIITKFDNTSVSGSTALVDLLAYYAAGETVEIEIAVPTSTGEYENKTVEITLGKAD